MMKEPTSPVPYCLVPTSKEPSLQGLTLAGPWWVPPTPTCHGILRMPIWRGVDLSDANLSGAELVTLDLSETDLSGADLSGANLSEATVSDEQLDTVRSL